MDDVSDRHEGTLDGLFAQVEETARVVVVVEVPAVAASLHSCQHTAWMLLNLLARQEKIVDAIYLDCPPAIPLAGRIVPLAARNVDLQTALLDGAAAIGAVPVQPGTSDSADFRFVVGPGPALKRGIRVHGERWWGGTTSHSAIVGIDAESPLPFGPYAAACIAASRVYLGVRLKTPAPDRDAFYSTWSLRSFAAPPTEPEDVGPAAVGNVEIYALLAGAGAVGNAWAHAIWATEGLAGRVVVADADELGVDRTNLNRCPALAAASIGKQKAAEVAQNCGDSPVNLVYFNGRVEDSAERPPLLISAVDTNTARRAVQALYPARLLAASTHNLRAEVVRTDPTSPAACISCHNPPESDVPDADLRREYLVASDEEKERLARELGHTREEADVWAVDGMCSNATDGLVEHLRASHAGAAAFSVGFVSVLAGTILAAQTIRELLDDRCLNGILCQATVTLLDPLAQTNAPGFYQRDAECPICDPTALAHEIWCGRYSSFARNASVIRSRLLPIASAESK
jgi:hypothetical protein